MRVTTGRDLVMGDAAVPAGTYTLWTLLDRTGWRLIVNEQTLRADGPGEMWRGRAGTAAMETGRAHGPRRATRIGGQSRHGVRPPPSA
jgi:hypothetical protein